MLSAGIILSVMVIPFIASVMRDVFEIVPPVLKESAYGLGCTTWEVVWNIVLPYTRVGVIGGIMLGLGRALGETMAVTFVIGNAYRISASLFAPGNSIASALANEFNEAADPVHRASLIALGSRAVRADADRAGAVALADRAARARRGGEDMSASDPALPQAPAASTASTSRCRSRRWLFGMAFLLWILFVLFQNGISALSPTLFTQDTPPPGSAGGLENAIFGSLVIVARATLISTPIGILAGIYLAEFGSGSRLASGDALHQRHPAVGAVDRHRPVRLHGLRRCRSATSPAGPGSMALALIAIPVVVRTTENMLQLVPNSLREAAVALGAPMWKVILMVTLKAVRGGVITGILLAVARISGETAPLLFTALNNQFWSTDMNAPMANLPVVIFQFAMSPFDDWKTLAWAGALLITLTVLLLNILARTVFRQTSVR